ncbi:hypothetical protein KR222_003422 [Zaprionus bogoriensis]|nr:hypothetical protein KR222_003422 [Zaprionus bogoriensis]
MIFPSEKKKELLRYASRNNPATFDADGTPMPTQRPQPPPPPHRLPPQTNAASSCCCSCASESATMRQLNTPPPPYCSTPCSIDCSGSFRLQQERQQEQASRQQQQPDTDMSVESDYSYITGGSSYASSGADLLSDENEQYPAQHPHPNLEPVRLLPMTSAATTTFVATAANMFRNCCGGGHTTDSSSGSVSRTSPSSIRRHILNHRQRTASTMPTCPLHPDGPALSTTAGGAAIATAATATSPAMRHRTLNQKLNALLKPFKSKQIAELLLALKSRLDPPPIGNNTQASQVIASLPSYLQCILIKCASPVDEQPHVTTCQMFFWYDLRGAGELRRLPTCPSARDSVYVCCNPLHWYRIIHPIDSEFAPPPYQRSKMLRLRDTDSEANTQNVERSTGVAWSTGNVSLSHSQNSHHSQSISSFIKQAESQLYVPSLESFTTDGKDHSAYSKGWCQIAYWELAQRVGEFFHAKKSAVNIYGEGPVDCGGDGMCLRDLGGKQPPLKAVQNTRQKVGLGVTLSLESGDVWIYNRSNVPIFVDSLTLAERLDRVCKVMPGYCLKAFETHRAQYLACKQSQHNQLGPIDRFSMKISFAKGWGNMYRRQDVMGCPCWLEVHFNHLR